MTFSKYAGRAFSLVFLPLMLTGLKAQEKVIPLKNWATPMYWHPNQAEKDAAAPQIVFSPNQVSTDALTFVAITPCRLVDTRGAGGGFNGNEPFSGPSIIGGGTATFTMSAAVTDGNTEPAPCGATGVGAEAYSFNLTVIPHTSTAGGVVGYVTMWPAGAARPVVATLNDGQGFIVNNAAIVGAGGVNDGVNVYNSGPATIDVVIDMNGFFAPPTDANFNTAIGTQALLSNTSGGENTAIGVEALVSNTVGFENTASGYQALLFNTSGGFNTANGVSALQDNTTGSGNTANGFQTLLNNTTGYYNTASGYQVLVNNTTGYYNTASGYQAMLFNTTGFNNVADGFQALQNNTAGHINTAVGTDALLNNTTGVGNIGIGVNAAISAKNNNNNSIYIGSQGSGGDISGTIQIGTQGTQTGGTFVAGISGVTTGGAAVPVLIDSNGQMGTVSSSARFKEDIRDMGEASGSLLRLRPVTFRYKQAYKDGSKPIDYGLIAEEVAQVYPDLVVRNKDGQIETVQYQKLTPMLLNEVQKQNAEVRELQAEFDQQRVKTARQNQSAKQQDETIRQLQERIAALEALLGKVPPTATAGQ